MTEVQHDPSAKSAAAQGSVIPLGWKPTPSKPVPVVRCIVIKKDGDRCNKWSLRGHSKCKSHLRGADLNFPNVREHIDAVIESARMRLVDDVDAAIDTLEFLAENGSEQIRLKASSEILDRAGIRGGFEIDVEVQQTENPSEILAKRLETLRKRHLEATSAVEDADIVDATVVDEDPQQETLF